MAGTTTAPAALARAIDLLERQVCNCMDAKGNPAKGKKVKVQCLRCELLDLLR